MISVIIIKRTSIENNDCCYLYRYCKEISVWQGVQKFLFLPTPLRACLILFINFCYLFCLFITLLFIIIDILFVWFDFDFTVYRFEWKNFKLKSKTWLNVKLFKLCYFFHSIKPRHDL